MNFNEERFLATISMVLRAGIVVFVVFSIIGYLIKPFNPVFSRIFFHSSVFFLLITPLIRLLILAWGFRKLQELNYFYYSIAVFIIVVFGMIF